MEQEAKRLLIKRLDESLLKHAAALGSIENGLTILEVYRVQELAELHCYLKTEHEYTAAEVEDLLRFADPLEAALACWEANPYEYSFPIDTLLKATGAYERFTLAEPTPPPEQTSVRVRLRTAIQKVNRQAPPTDHDHSGYAR